MEENKDNKENNKFKFAKPSKIEPKEKKGAGFGKSVILPFCSGIIGAALVVGVYFGIPSVKNNLLTAGSSTSTSTGTQSVGTQNLVSLNDFFTTIIQAI